MYFKIDFTMLRNSNLFVRMGQRYLLIIIKISAIGVDFIVDLDLKARQKCRNCV